VLYVALVLSGLILGLIVGQWWALGAAAALGVGIALGTEVDEVPAWYRGAGYATLAAVGIAAGVAGRRSNALTVLARPLAEGPRRADNREGMALLAHSFRRVAGQVEAPEYAHDRVGSVIA
jgi:hypothetical protein